MVANSPAPLTLLSGAREKPGRPRQRRRTGISSRAETGRLYGDGDGTRQAARKNPLQVSARQFALAFAEKARASSKRARTRSGRFTGMLRFALIAPPGRASRRKESSSGFSAAPTAASPMRTRMSVPSGRAGSRDYRIPGTRSWAPIAISVHASVTTGSSDRCAFTAANAGNPGNVTRNR